jgi:hypothetical protein
VDVPLLPVLASCELAPDVPEVVPEFADGAPVEVDGEAEGGGVGVGVPPVDPVEPAASTVKVAWSPQEVVPRNGMDGSAPAMQCQLIRSALTTAMA